MWLEFRDEAEVELGLLHHLLSEYQPLFEKVASGSPDRVELLALAGVLQSFYNGIEAVLKRSTKVLEGAMPDGPSWHSELLDIVSRANSARPGIISSEMRDRLKPYLEFRHVVRHAYSFQIEWRRMAPLVMGCRDTLARFEAELRAFFDGRICNGNSP